MSPSTSQPNEAFDHSLALRGLQGPAHRWKTAEELPPCRFDPLVQCQDQYVQSAHHFQQLAKRGTAGTAYAAALYPQIAEALLLDQEKTKVDRMKIGVLGDLAWEEIARDVGADVEVVKTWSALFYDAGGSREAIGWVADHIVQPELDAGNVELATKLRLVAAVGPVGARAALDLDSHVPVTAGGQLFRRKLQLSLRYDQALAMTEGPEYHFRFVKHYGNLKMQEARLQVAERKLTERCTAALRKHELAKIRLEIALEHEKGRSAVREVRKAETAALVQEGKQYEAALAAERLRAFDRAEQQAAAARAATSPLSKLRWESPQSPRDESLLPSLPVTLTDTNPTEASFCSIPFPQEDLSMAGQVAAAVPA